MVTLDTLLDIEGLVIEKTVITNEGNIDIYVKSTIDGTYCHKCAGWITKPYGHAREIRLQHLSIFGHKTFIVISLPKYMCDICETNPTTTQHTDWHESRSPHTKQYEEHILIALINSTVEDVSIKESIGYEAVMGIIDRHISKTVDWNNIDKLDTLGIDEISLKKGHKDFVTVITGCANERVTILGIVNGRKKEDIKSFFRDMPRTLRKQVKCVCSDMYDGFINAVKEIFGKRVKIIADRFHVAKLYRKGLEQIRMKEMKRLKEEIPKEDYDMFKGVMWILRKRESELMDEERNILKELFTLTPVLGIAYALCNQLTDIFDSNISKAKAKKAIKNWANRVIQSGLSCFDGFISTLNERIEEITNYFINRQNSGFVEGFNNKIKVIKRRCYGILNPVHLFQRIFLDVEGYALFA